MSDDDYVTVYDMPEQAALSAEELIERAFCALRVRTVRLSPREYAAKDAHQDCAPLCVALCSNQTLNVEMELTFKAKRNAAGALDAVVEWTCGGRTVEFDAMCELRTVDAWSAIVRALCVQLRLTLLCESILLSAPAVTASNMYRVLLRKVWSVVSSQCRRFATAEGYIVNDHTIHWNCVRHVLDCTAACETPIELVD